MAEQSGMELIYDWNMKGELPAYPKKKIMIVDETLRDGLQSPSLRIPRFKTKSTCSTSCVVSKWMPPIWDCAARASDLRMTL